MTRAVQMAKHVAAFAVAAALGTTFPASVSADPKPDIATLTPGPVNIRATRIANFNRSGDASRFGKLTFRGGLVLNAPDAPNFGGWSGLALDEHAKRFIAVSDGGAWLTGALDYDGAALAGVSDARMGPLLALDGKPLNKPRDRDAEAVTLMSGSLSNGALLIAFEQNARIARYDVTAQGVSASRGFLEKPVQMRKIRRNTGLEAMTVVRGGAYKGATIAMAERHYNSARNHTGWIWTSKGAQEFYLTNIGDFDVTDIASLDDGALFLLERRFRWLEGVKMRIRRIAPGDFAPGKTLDGEILVEATLEQEIDNMEGLAATRAQSGDVLLTLISDDNFNSFLQRTMVLQFTLSDEKQVEAAPPK
ncbi:MAG: esterase-like activity of phytase family protein [Hyphomicrobium sp.]